MSEAVEILAVTFFEQPVLAARLTDGTIVLSIRDLCTTTGLNLSSQSAGIRRKVAYAFEPLPVAAICRNLPKSNGQMLLVYLCHCSLHPLPGCTFDQHPAP